ncbi:MAG: hypothetical protein Q4G70_14515 [Pseudomonadota bacterium]|nr:hypothetical protein [Pseudomonadota bacterium]
MNSENYDREPTEDERRGMEWWNAASELQREFWLRVASSARPADAWAAYKFAMLEREGSQDG